ncbi:MarR family winged helix-turn-helix transcriptional regulator [Actinocorallia sp. A-T 12471]|uniref:MarR family winged helix-turn-helix transcriptional regulator n=1 Tax=Actinocorallia sp. A-T 12471 TaxID=3089813 RepID=UPI0029D179E6|nr:MarR family winged helix-turn-helix transcriptional regulator [Actinocorallia sp. A-T 12471]MDX6739182.1 MarR family winged helix-turn-helix transcriptional regulator [Actinocorallia sp. A-T 12471]
MGPAEKIEYEMMLLGRHSQVFGPHGRHSDRMDRSAYVLLSRILLDGPMTIRRLSEAFGLDQSTLNRQTSALLRAGLVERIADPDAGIARQFRITADGERRLEEERLRTVDSVEKVVKDWTTEERETFAAFLRRFNTDVEHLSGRPWPRP